jgi:hypothetical protein
MCDFRPLLYFLKECEHTRDVFVDHDFISSDDLILLDEATSVPRTAEFIWIYQKLSEYCKKVNENYYQFQISGFGKDLCTSEDSEWTLSIDKGQLSTNKLNVILWRGEGSLYMNHNEYTVDGRRGTIMIFPSYLWWKGSGDFLICNLSGNHFT